MGWTPSVTCEGFDYDNTTIELAFSTFGCVLTVVGATLLLRQLRRTRQIRPGETCTKRDLIWWVAFTDLGWGMPRGLLFALFLRSVTDIRPDDWCSGWEFNLFRSSLYLLSYLFDGASKGYNCLVGYLLLKMMREMAGSNPSAKRNITVKSNPSFDDSMASLERSSAMEASDALLPTAQQHLPALNRSNHFFAWGLGVTYVLVVSLQSYKGRAAFAMAGLGLYFHLSVQALAPRGLLRSAYDFLCLIYTKSSRASWKAPGQFRPTLGATRKKRFLGPPARLW
jgi:hypothetical protein